MYYVAPSDSKLLRISENARYNLFVLNYPIGTIFEIVATFFTIQTLKGKNSINFEILGANVLTLYCNYWHVLGWIFIIAAIPFMTHNYGHLWHSRKNKLGSKKLI